MKQIPRLTGTYRAEVIRHDGSVESYYIENDVVDVGLNLILDGLDSSTGALYVGLITHPATALANADTMVSHSGWTESTAYAGSRKTWTSAAAASQKVTNAASPAEFTMNATVTIYGCFLNTAASGAGGILFSTGQFQKSDGSALTTGIALVDTNVLKIVYELEAKRV